MLTQLYRYGPTRQRILKGFVVAGAQPERTIAQVMASGTGRPAGDLSLRVDERFPTCLWLDTGMVWLHTARARREGFGRLADGVRALAQLVQQAGGQLLPGAVRPAPTDRWDRFVCGDRHLLETIDDFETEVYCNLLRRHLPALIAFTGRAGAGPQGVEPLASRRLCDSSHHLTARYLASVSPHHLRRVVQCLRRDQGVGRLDLLDVHPVAAAADAPNCVEIRFTDGQILPASVRAEALLYQALLIRARRLSRNGRRVGNVPQGLVERNRVRAVADGLQARFEEDRDQDAGRAARAPRAGGRPGPAGAATGPSRAFVLARDAFLELLEDLRREFQALEVEFAEIAPLVLGSGLRAMGLPGLQNENDLLREFARRGGTQPSGLLTQVAPWMGRFAPDQDDPLTALNRERFAQPTQQLQRWWDLVLRLPEADESPAGEEHAAPDRPGHPAQDRRRDDGRERAARRPPDDRRDQRPGPSPRPPEETPAPTDRRGPPAAPRGQGPDPVLQAALELVRALRGLGPAATNADRVRCLRDFRRAGHPPGLQLGRVLSRADAQELWDRLGPALHAPHVADDPGRAWDDPRARDAGEAARRDGLAFLVLLGPPEQEQGLRALAQRMSHDAPADLELYLWRSLRVPDGGRQLAAVELIVACAPQEGGPPA